MGITGGPDVVREGVSLAVDAGDIDSYTTGSAVWRDVSRNRTNGSLSNSPGFTNANKGAIVFNGSNTSVTMPISTQLGNTAYSIEFLLLVSATSAVYGVMLWGSGPFNTGGRGIEIRFQNSTLEYTLNDGTGTGTRLQYAVPNLANGQFRHYVITQALRGTAILYINGVNVANQSYSAETTFTNTYNMLIGRGTDGFLNGRISNFKVYTKALSPREVSKNYDAMRSRFNR